MYRFLLRPAWLVSHLLVLALVVAMINLSLWQVRRLQSQKDRNAQVEANSTANPIDVGEATELVRAEGAEAARYRPVAIRGAWDPDAEVAIRSRSNGGAPGRWVATPFRPAEGGPAVLIVRGWIPQAIDDISAPIEEVAPTTDVVSVLGYLEPTQERGSFGSIDADEGILAELSRVDVARFDDQYALEVAPFWLQLAEQAPPREEALPAMVPLPDPDDGPHLGYAVQWAIFTLIALVGYPMILRRVAHQRAVESAAGSDGTDEPGEGTPAEKVPAGG